MLQVVACGQEKKSSNSINANTVENSNTALNLQKLNDDDLKIFQIKKAQNHFKIRKDSIYDNTNKEPLLVYNRYVDIINPNTHKVIKTIDSQSFNPYNNKEKLEPIYGQLIGKVKLKGKNKESISDFLPKSQYANISTTEHQDWAEIFSDVKIANNNYVIGTFAFEWFGVDDRDEFSRGEFSTTTIIVWDTLGREVFKSKFDFAFPFSEISIDGKYILINGGKYYGGYSPFNFIKLLKTKTLEEIPLKLIAENRSIIISYSLLTDYLVIHSESMENTSFTNLLIVDSKKEKIYVCKNTELVYNIEKVNDETLTISSPNSSVKEMKLHKNFETLKINE